MTIVCRFVLMYQKQRNMGHSIRTTYCYMTSYSWTKRCHNFDTHSHNPPLPVLFTSSLFWAPLFSHSHTFFFPRPSLKTFPHFQGLVFHLFLLLRPNNTLSVPTMWNIPIDFFLITHNSPNANSPVIQHYSSTTYFPFSCTSWCTSFLYLFIYFFYWHTLLSPRNAPVFLNCKQVPFLLV